MIGKTLVMYQVTRADTRYKTFLAGIGEKALRTDRRTHPFLEMRRRI